MQWGNIASFIVTKAVLGTKLRDPPQKKMELNYAIPIGTQLRDPGDPLLSSLEYVRTYARNGVIPN